MPANTSARWLVGLVYLFFLAVFLAAAAGLLVGVVLSQGARAPPVSPKLRPQCRTLLHPRKALWLIMACQEHARACAFSVLSESGYEGYFFLAERSIHEHPDQAFAVLDPKPKTLNPKP